MKKMIVSICSLAVFLTLFAGLSLPITASAQVSGDFEYYIYRSGGTNGVDELAISAYNGTATEVVVPSEIDGRPVVGIGSRAFYECYDITAIELPNTLQYLGYGAFEYCERLQSVDLPNSLTSLSDDVFAFCRSLETITIPDSVNEIGNGLFYYCTSLKNITLPSGITSIPALTFMGCEKLETVTIPSTVTTVGECAFYNCAKLKEITLPSGVTVIEDEAFCGCACLKEIQIPDSVKRIGVYTFSGCNGLKSVIIPGTVTTIGDWAFYNCTSLESVTIGDAVMTIGEAAFWGCTSLVSVLIPDSVTTIGEGAFRYCHALVSVTIGDAVKTIGDCAFNFCSSLESVTIGDSVTTIGDGTFIGCYLLESVTVTENNSTYCDMDGVLFSKDKTTLLLYPSGKSATSYTIPDSVTTIVNEAFSYCDSLERVTIPDSVTTIEDGAFYDCYSLDDVYYSGKKAQWKNIVNVNENESLTSACIHYNVTEDDIADHWQLQTVQWEPSCEWDGEAIYACDCGYEVGRAIPATGHTLRFIETIAPTCTQWGYTLYECTTCWEMVAEDHIPGGHTFENNVCVNCDGAVEECLASAHKYASNTYQSWYVWQEGAKSISLTFSPDTEVEEDCDYLYIYDSEGELFGEYTGTELAGAQITVPGDFAEIVLASDKSMNYYGFAVTDVCANYGVRGDVDGDGVANANDVATVFYFVNAVETLSEEQSADADCNKDGKVNLYDVARLFYMVNGLV